MSDPARTFGPVVVAGLATAGLTAIATRRAWFSLDSIQATGQLQAELSPAHSPLAAALSLVVLALWGITLIAARRFRRWVGACAALCAAGVVVATVRGFWTVPEALGAAAAERGLEPSTSISAWFWVAALAALASLGCTAAALGWSVHWPELSSRYERRGDTAPDLPVGAVDEPSNLDLWKAIDEGRDPTS